MDESGTGYNMPSIMELSGTVDKERLEQTFSALICRHESLRTSFAMIGNDPVQRIHKENYKLQITNYKQSRIPGRKLPT